MKSHDFLKSVTTILLSILIALFYSFGVYWFFEMICIVALSLLLTEIIFGRLK